MRKGLLIGFVVLLLLCSCMDPASQMDFSQGVNLEDIDFSGFSRFAILADDSSVGKGLQGNGYLYGYDVERNILERIKIFVGGILEATVSDITKIGEDYLFVRLRIPNSFREFIIDVRQNKVFDVTKMLLDLDPTGMNTQLSADYCYQTDKGIAFPFMGDVYLLDVKANAAVSMATNESINYENYYVSPNGNLLVFESNYYSQQRDTRFFSADGSLPIFLPELNLMYFLADMPFMICSPTANYIADLQSGRLIDFSDNTLRFVPIDYDGSLTGRPLFSKKTDFTQPNYVRFSNFRGGKACALTESQIVETRIIRGELVIKTYDVPAEIMSMLSRASVVYEKGKLVFDYNHSLYVFDTAERKLKELCTDRVAHWDRNGNAIEFTKYLTATSFATYSWDFDTGEITHLLDSEIKPIEFVYFE